MKNIFSKFSHRVIPAVFITLLAVANILAQGTGFVYQGRLTNSNLAVNAPYDFQFSLFDAASGGTQIGPTNTQTSIPVSNGSFAVTLDFGAAAFPGANRWLEISARPAGNGAFTLLTPRLPITPTPYAIKSLTANAADGLSESCNGCVSGRQISDLPTGNGNYIQNTTAQQTANFNISGNGLIGGSLGIGTTNPLSRLHVADSTANFKFYSLPNTTVTSLENTAPNSLVALNLQNNSRAWQLRVDGSDASKFRIFDATAIADRLIIDPTGNVGIGTTNPLRKLHLLDSTSNLLFGSEAGSAVMRLTNSAPGGIAALNLGNTAKDWQLRIDGFDANKFSLFDATAVAYRLTVDGSGNVGIGTTSPAGKLHISSAGFLAPQLVLNQTISNDYSRISLRREGNQMWDIAANPDELNFFDNVGGVNTLRLQRFGQEVHVRGGLRVDTHELHDGTISNMLIFGPPGSVEGIGSKKTAGGNQYGLDFYTGGSSKMSITHSGFVGIGTSAPMDKLQVTGDLRIGTNNALSCIKNFYGSAIAGTCSSDLRFKQQITPFSNLLDKVTRLQPVHFYWRAEEFPTRHFGTEQSFGLIAQDVEAVLPELVATDEEGYRAVNYSKLPLLTLQAVKELKGEQDSLKAQNLVLQEQNATLQARLDKLEQTMRQLLEAAEKPSPKQP